MFGRETLVHMGDAGGTWLLLALGLVLVVLSGALVFRWLISPIVGKQLRALAEAAEAVAAGDLTRAPRAANRDNSSTDLMIAVSPLAKSTIVINRSDHSR